MLIKQIILRYDDARVNIGVHVQFGGEQQNNS